MFKNDYPYEDVPYWTPWRIFSGLYLLACALVVLFLIMAFLFEIPATLWMGWIVGAPNWLVGLLVIQPLLFLVCYFSMVPYGDD